MLFQWGMKIELYLYYDNFYKIIVAIKPIQVLTVVFMKDPSFWDIIPCSPLKINGRFLGIFSLNLQG
jgi:hypothetical protein